MKVLIIGGTGLISSGIVKALQARGADLTVFNRGRTDDRLGAVRRLNGDRNDFAAFERTMAATGNWDVVIDMICFRPDQAESALRAFAGRCGHFLFCSTVCTYGNTQTVVPTLETTPQAPHSAYGRDKVACEQLLLKAQADGRMNVTIFRPSHTYGPGGNVINMKLSPSVLEGDEGLTSLAYLIRTCFDLGGIELQFNTIDREVLQEAMEKPRDYEHLITRVSGFSAHFVLLDKSIQQDILNRTEHRKLQSSR